MKLLEELRKERCSDRGHPKSYILLRTILAAGISNPLLVTSSTNGFLSVWHTIPLFGTLPVSR